MAAEPQVRVRIDPWRLRKMLERMVGTAGVTAFENGMLPQVLFRKPIMTCMLSIRVRDGVDAQITCRADTETGFRFDRGVCLVHAKDHDAGTGRAANIDQALCAPAITHVQAMQLVLDVIDHVRAVNVSWERQL